MQKYARLKRHMPSRRVDFPTRHVDAARGSHRQGSRVIFFSGFHLHEFSEEKFEFVLIKKGTADS